MVLWPIFLQKLFCATFNCDYAYPYPTSASLDLGSNSHGFQKVDPVVFTPNGGFEGYFLTVVSGREVYAFEGIPYAEPPVGKYRFRDPVPRRPWYGIRPVKAPGPDCLQLNLPKLMRIVGHENCLYLNVYSSQIPGPGMPSKNLSTLIFIHGGNFYYGAGQEYGPAYLLQENLIYVSINYRLGVLGFMSTGDESSLGNWGLKDQALAIKWVADNIAYFGGDPNKITVSGQSAGAISTHLQMLSTTSIARGLFSKAISFSGSAYHHWGLQTPEFANLLTKTLAEAVNCPTNKSQALVDCFRRMNANFLVGAQRRLFVSTFFPLMIFSPVIEANATGAFITAPPEKYYEQDLVMKIPYWCTNVIAESHFIFMALDNLMITSYYRMNYESLMPMFYDYGRYVDYPSIVTKVLAATYFEPDKIHRNGMKMDRSIMMEIGTDRYFTVANRRALRAHSKIAPTYSYIYHFKSKSGLATYQHHDFRKWNATHVEDLTSIFNCTVYFLPLERGTLHFELSKKMISLLVNFANTGVPLLSKEDGSHEEIWKPITSPDHLQFLEIGPDASFSMVPESPDKARKLKAFDWLGL